MGLFLRYGVCVYFFNGHCVTVPNLPLLVACYSEKIVAEDIPANMEALVAEKRRELIEAVSEVDDKLAEVFLNDEPVSSTELEVRQHAF